MTKLRAAEPRNKQSTHVEIDDFQCELLTYKLSARIQLFPGTIFMGDSWDSQAIERIESKLKEHRDTARQKTRGKGGEK